MSQVSGCTASCGGVRGLRRQRKETRLTARACFWDEVNTMDKREGLERREPPSGWERGPSGAPSSLTAQLESPPPCSFF